MKTFVVRTSGTDLPAWVVEHAEERGLILIGPRTDELLAPDVIAEELAELGADGYLLNGPGYGPYVDGQLLDAAGGLSIVSYLGQSAEPAAYASFADLDATLGARFAELPELFAESDAVSLHTPPASSEGLITEEVLANANGIDLVDTTSIAKGAEPEALLLALERGHVARAAIEGTLPEPYDELLREFGDDRVLLLPPYTTWNTEQDRRAGWMAYLDTLTALRNARELPYRLA